MKLELKKIISKVKKNPVINTSTTDPKPEDLAKAAKMKEEWLENKRSKKNKTFSEEDLLAQIMEEKQRKRKEKEEKSRQFYKKFLSL